MSPSHSPQPRYAPTTPMRAVSFGPSAAPRTTERRNAGRGGESPRVRTQLRLRLTLSGEGRTSESEQIREMLTGDLSSGGVFVHCSDPPAVGLQARVEVCRPHGGLAFTAIGEVAWRRAQSDRLGRPPGFGLRFERLDLRDGGVIDGLVNLLQRQHAATQALPAASSAALLLHGIDDMTSDVVNLLQVELPDELRTFVEGFNRVADRDGFLWRWAYQGIHLTTLSCVDPALHAVARDGKLLGTMYLILLDDALDRAAQEGGERQRIFDTLCHLPTSGARPFADPADAPAVAFGKHLLGALYHRVESLPRAAEFLRWWRLDLQQITLDARYQLMTRTQPCLASATEGATRAAAFCGLPLLLSSSVDLCASPSFDVRETGLLREVLGLAQRMHFTGFVLSGWERACGVGDLSGAAVTHGIMTGVLSPDELAPEHASRRGESIAQRLRAARVDSHFLTEWLRLRHQTRELAMRLRSVDVQRLLQAHQRLLWLQIEHLGMR